MLCIPVHTYPDLSCSTVHTKFNTKLLELLTDHAVVNNLRQLSQDF